MKMMILVMLACISPWVRNRARTLNIKALRLMKLPDRMGWWDFRSAKVSPARLTAAAINTIVKGRDVQPKFCPKEGMHSSRLKKIRIRTAPDISKFCGGFFVDV